MIDIYDIAPWLFLAIIVAIVALLTWAAIDSIPILDEGIVVEKEHEPQRLTYHYRKIGNIHQMVPIIDDEDWVLVV